MRRSKNRHRFTAALKHVGVARLFLVTVGGVVGATFAFAIAVSGVTRIKNPQMGLLFVPNESVALAARADQLFFASPQKPAPAVRTLARAALLEQAINPKALRILGYLAETQGKSALAESLVQYSASLSRRESGAQLWLIEANARRNDTRRTLMHYDILLRTKPEAQTLLFPRLVAAMEDPAVRTALIPYIKGDSSWTAPFLFYANSNSKNLAVVVDLVLESGGLADADASRSQMLGLLERLVKAQQFAEARRLYLGIRGNSPTKLTSIAFTDQDRTGRFGAMGWQLVVDPDAGGQFIESAVDKSTRLAIFANASTTRTVASKLLFLEPGGYKFVARLASIDDGSGGMIRWQLRCPANETSQTIWRFDSTASTARDAFEIPPACPVQFLDLAASGGRGQTGLEATVASISVAPANK